MDWSREFPNKTGYYWWRPEITSDDKELEHLVNTNAEIVYVALYPESFESHGAVNSFVDGEEPIENFSGGMWSYIEPPEFMDTV